MILQKRMTFSTQTQYLEYFPEVRDQRWLFFCVWYIIIAFVHAPYKGQEPKKGFVCVFATSCEISFRDIPKINRVSNIIPWPNISKKFVCQQQKICPKNRANIIDPTHFGYQQKFMCRIHRCLKHFRRSRWMPVIGVLMKVVLQISVTPFPGFQNQWLGQNGGVCFFVFGYANIMAKKIRANWNK